MNKKDQEIESLEATIDELEANNSLDERIILRLQKDRDAEREARQRAVTRGQKLLEERNALMTRLSEVQIERDQLLSDIVTLRAAKKAMEDGWAKLQTKHQAFVAGAAQAGKELQAKIDQLENENESLRNAFAGACDRVYDLHKDIAKLVDQNGELRSRYAADIIEENFYIVDWDNAVVKMSRSYADWPLAVKDIPKGYPLYERFDVLRGDFIRILISPRFGFVDEFDV